MPWWTWVIIGVFITVVLALATALSLRAIRALQDARTTQRRVLRALGELLEAAGQLEERLATLAERRARVERATDSLRSSFAKLSLLGWALADTRAAAARFRKAVPRK